MKPFDKLVLDFFNTHGVAPSQRDLSVVMHNSIGAALTQAEALRCLLSSADPAVKAKVEQLCTTLKDAHGRT